MALTWDTACFGNRVVDAQGGRFEVSLESTGISRRFRKTKHQLARQYGVVLVNLTATEAKDLRDEFETVEHTGVLRFTPPGGSAIAGRFMQPSPVPIATSGGAFRMLANIEEVFGIDVPV